MRLTKPGGNCELGPEDLSARLFLSDCLSQLGRNDEVINVARNGLAVFPYDSSLRYTLGLALARKGDFAGATNQFACALLLEPVRVDAQVNFGRVLLRLGNAPEGLRHLQEAVRLAPGSPLVLNDWHGCWPPIPMQPCAMGRKPCDWPNMPVR